MERQVKEEKIGPGSFVCKSEILVVGSDNIINVSTPVETMMVAPPRSVPPLVPS